MTDLRFDELNKLFQSISKKEIATEYNKLSIDDRIEYLFRLEQNSYIDYKDFIDDLVDGGKQLRANYERKLILQGKSTNNWIPEQIESILNIDSDTGIMNPNLAGS